MAIQTCPRWLLNVLLALLLLCSAGKARYSHFIIEKNKATVKEPPSIAGVYEAAIGDFGVPLYGGTLQGRVEHHADNADGCRDFATAPPPPGGDDPRIFLVDRGDCYFVEKAWHAQQAGANAVVVADNKQEALVTMAVPFDHKDKADLVENITIPVVLVSKDTGDRIKSGLGDSGGAVVLELDWRESITHPDDRVEWEFWFSTNDGCGEACASQKAFIRDFHLTAVSLERGNHTQFTPRVLTRRCYSWMPHTSERCRRDCIHGGRYCVWDSVAEEYKDTYRGAQVVEENKRHLCVFQQLNGTHRPWVWWDFAARFAGECTMASGRFGRECAEEQMRGVGVEPSAVAACMGGPGEDAPSPFMDAEVAAQRDEEGSGRGKVIMLPTIVINRDQYRGRLDAPSLLRALCAGFGEGTEPHLCLTGGLNVDECAAGKDDCWRGPAGVSACMDTFRGFVCHCPPGWQGDGHSCEDIDECALHIDGCDHKCINTEGSYRCECNRGYTLHGGLGSPGVCVPSHLSAGFPLWALLLVIAGTLAFVAAGGLAVYKWRLRHEMQNEVRSIMRQYMPLEAQERGDLDRSLLSSPQQGGRRGGGGGSGKHGSGKGAGAGARMVDEDDYLSPSGPPAGAGPSLTELAQTASPRLFPSI